MRLNTLDASYNEEGETVIYWVSCLRALHDDVFQFTFLSLCCVFQTHTHTTNFSVAFFFTRRFILFFLSFMFAIHFQPHQFDNVFKDQVEPKKHRGHNGKIWANGKKSSHAK